MSTETEYVSKTEFDTLMKQFKKMQKQMRKVMKHFKDVEVPDDKPKKLSGFAKPTRVSPELSKFLGLQDDELIARTEVTKRINAYVKSNNLQNAENKRVIVLDDTLRALINSPEGMELTFFNLQKYIKHHYIDFNKKEETKPEPAPATSEEPKTSTETKKVVKKKVVKK
jgi:upstream activation factor subunit UAF30